MAVQFLFLWFLGWFCGIKNNPIVTIVIFVSIVFFNLIIPYGRIIYTAGIFKITEGALVTGIKRAVTLEGLIMLSRLSIRQDLKISGFIGSIITDTFYLFAYLTSNKKNLSKPADSLWKDNFNLIKKLTCRIDNLFLELSEIINDNNVAFVKEPVKKNKTKPAGFIILFITAGLMYSLLLWGIAGGY